MHPGKILLELTVFTRIVKVTFEVNIFGVHEFVNRPYFVNNLQKNDGSENFK